VVIRVDVLPIVPPEAVLVAEVIGGFFGQAQLGRYWLPCTELADGEQPEAAARRALAEQLGLTLEAPRLVGARRERVAGREHLALAVAGVAAGQPELKAPLSGFSARAPAALPDQLGFYHRDDIAILRARHRALAPLA
jgi:ADP-ribose pyrophosphatase YjhB (NUDIX family)